MAFLKKIPFLLFGLLFSGVGAFIFYETGWMTLNDWQHMQSWQSVDAELLDVKGHENDTEASYRYQVDQFAYENDRVYVASFKDNIGSYHADLQQQLKKKYRKGESIRIWFNPDKPTESVIDRDMRWGMFTIVVVFCSVFFLVGVFVMWAALKASRKTNKASRSEQTVNWQSRKGWETPNIRSNAKSTMAILWIFAIVWNAVSSPIVFVFQQEWQSGNYAVVIGLLFPLVGMGLLYAAIKVTREYLRFGRVLYEMDPWPGAIGGHVGGRIHVKNWGRSSGSESVKSKVMLECVKSYVSGSGKNRSRRENILWAQEGIPAIENYGNGLALAFRFDVPEDLPQADVEQSGTYHFWRLSVEAEAQGIKLERKYTIPVIVSSAQSRYVTHDISEQVEEKAREKDEEIRDSIASGNFDIAGLSRAMDFTEFGGEMRMAFPMFRNKGLTLFAMIFAGGFGFASYSMLTEFSDGGFFQVFIWLFSVPFVLVALFASVATVYLMFNNLRVIFTQTEISVLRRLLFIPIYFRRFRPSDIDQLFFKTNGSTGSGVKKIEHFKIRARLRDGSKVTLAEDIDGESAAKHFRDYLVRRFNISDSL
ncbi:MAG: DUF3592 domain-containing protein [Gammaproteobacteria bacterium]|nr:DUF3592 domain-containing protein [Gammaproteobacteria bacterium]NNJ91158.1 DUF3592 domain-containing protein [Gammaproteobacteria bacterium]